MGARDKLPAAAKRLAGEFADAAARFPGNEAEFRNRAENALGQCAAELGVEIDARHELTLATGIADAVFNRLVIEWEPPGAMSAKREGAGNLHAVEQVQRYVNGLAAKERRVTSRLAGVACDGHFMIFARYREKRWVVDEPVAVGEGSAALLLQSLLAAQSGRALIADNLLDDFAGERALAQAAIPALLQQLEIELGHRPEGLPARLFAQWERAFAVATGVTSGDKTALKADARKALASLLGRKASDTDPARSLFVIQTYFAIVTKLIATLSLTLFVEQAKWDIADLRDLSDEDLINAIAELQRGEPFRSVGMLNVVEPDVFTWFLERTRVEVADAIRDIVERLSGYDPATLQVSPEDARDLLKDLYEGLLPRPVRHALGQYFTPDWLASVLLDSVRYEGGRDERVLDPACGTGTFLVGAIGRLKRSMEAEGMNDDAIAASVLNNIVGFDIDPLAVVAARANYVLALGSLVGALPEGGSEIPVYRADSILSPTLLDMRQVDRLELDTSVGKFTLPLCVNTAEELRAVCDLAIRGLEAGWDPASYATEARGVCGARDDEAEVLATFFTECQRLHTEAIDGIWTRVIRNAFMPAFIGHFDLVVGNPPWVNWEGLPETYRERTRHLWDEAGLFVHKGMDALLGKGKKDVSMLMSYVVSEQLLAEHGRLGFVMPETLFKTAGAGQGFRRFRFGNDRTGTPFRVVGVHDMVDLRPFPGAANRTAVLVWERDATTQYPVAYTVWQRRNPVGTHRHSTPSQVEEATRRLQLEAAPVRAEDSTSAWLTLPRRLIAPMRSLAETAEPHYRAHAGVFAGANGVYWIESQGAPDAKGLVPISNLHDIGKTTVPKRYGAVESELVHPLVRGSDVSRWSAVPSAQMLFVQDPETKRGIAAERMADEFPGALAFLAQFEDILRARRGVRNLLESGAPYWSMFGVGDYTLAPHKVVWKDIAGDFAAAVLEEQDPLPLPGHTVMLVVCESVTEAHYLCGALNSTPPRALIAAYVATHISTHPTQVVHVPAFRSDDAEHQRLAEASRSAHDAVAAGKEPDQEAVDRAAAGLWGLTEAEIASIRDFLSTWLKQDLARA